MKARILLTIVSILMFQACAKLELDEEEFVYFNDFESSDLSGLVDVYISRYDNKLVMGPFNNDGFSLSLPNLPDHDFIRVTFDLYIHDSWEGNVNDDDGTNLGADRWFMEFDRGVKIKSADKILFETTFSNGLCIPGFCFMQSYPEYFPFSHEAREEAATVDLPGFCLWQDTPIGTSLYRIDRIFPHRRNSTTISFYDQLVDASHFQPLCDESWSLDNLSVSVFKRR